MSSRSNPGWGPGPDDGKEAVILNRIIRWTESWIEYEADLRQAEKMVARDSDLKHTNKKVVVDLLQKKHQAEENYRKLRETLIDLDEELDLHGHRQVAELFEKSRLAKRNGTRQYPWQMTLLLVESLVTGASPSAIKKLLVIFSQHFSPRKPAMDQPGSKLSNK